MTVELRTESQGQPREPSGSALWFQRVRQASLVIHRWVGLSMAVFLTVAGVTGCLLAFYTDLDAALNPELFRVQPPAPGAQMLDPLVLRDKLLAQLPTGTEVPVMLRLKPDRSVNYWIAERETFVDPYTGALLGSRKFGDLREGKKNLLTFLYEFHFSLALGEVGSVLFGVVALLWTFDCFVGAYLTLPPQRAARQAGSARKSWFSRWLPAWLLKTNKLFTLVFTWHRASGLWIWGFLLVFAWSGVALNLRQVYAAAMDVLLVPLPQYETEHLPEPKPAPKLDMRQALALGRSLMAAEATRGSFEVLSESGLYYEPEHGAYIYSVESTLDVDARLAETSVTFDGDDGRQLLFSAAGASARGTIDQWLIGLHFGAIRGGGVAYRGIVSLLGLGVALLSITGVWIWLRKRGKTPVDKRLGPSQRARQG